MKRFYTAIFAVALGLASCDKTDSEPTPVQLGSGLVATSDAKYLLKTVKIGDGKIGEFEFGENQKISTIKTYSMGNDVYVFHSGETEFHYSASGNISSTTSKRIATETSFIRDYNSKSKEFDTYQGDVLESDKDYYLTNVWLDRTYLRDELGNHIYDENGYPEYTEIERFSYRKYKTVKIGDVLSHSENTHSYDENNRLTETSSAHRLGAEADSKLVNTYDADGKIIKVQGYYKTEAGWQKNDSYVSLEYNAQGLLSAQYLNRGEDAKEKISEIKYDETGNPIEILGNKIATSSGNGYYYYYNRPISYNPSTGETRPVNLTTDKEEFSSLIKLKYSKAPNFFGENISLLFPELKGFKIHNAPTRVEVSDTYIYGDLKYSDYNDALYPQTLVGYGIGNGGSSMRIELNFEYEEKK